MNRKVNKLQSVQALRALAVIIVMLLTSATTWAEETIMTNVSYMDWNASKKELEATTTPDGTNVYVLTGTETTLGTNGQETWYICNGALNYTSTLTIYGDVHLILADDCAMTITTTGNNKAIFDDYLTIYGQSTGDKMGSLTATSSESDVCISVCRLTANGCKISATAPKKGICVFGSNDGDGIFINGSEISATGTNGYGLEASRDINITTGSEVTANGVQYGMITSSGITIDASKVNATGTRTVGDSYGLKASNAINITNGSEVTANGGQYGMITPSGITIDASKVKATGGLYGMYAQGITINSGQVEATTTSTNSDNYGLYAYGNFITLGWKNASDYIKASSYGTPSYESNKVNTAAGKRFVAYDPVGEGEAELAASGIIGDATTAVTISDLTTIAGKTLRPLDGYLLQVEAKGITPSGYNRAFTLTTGEGENTVTTHYYVYKADDDVTLTLPSLGQSGVLLTTRAAGGTDDATTDYAVTTTNNVATATLAMPASDLTVKSARYYATGVDYLDWDDTEKKLVKKNTATDDNDANDKVWILTGGTATTLPGGWYVVMNKNTDAAVNNGIDAAYTGTLEFTGATHLILADDAEMTVDNQGDGYAIVVNNNDAATLDIYGQAHSSGALTATSASSVAIFIFSDNSGTPASLTINGGKVKADGVDNGIKVSSSGGTATATITGGKVTARGDYFGIYASSLTSAPPAAINITGGQVETITNSYGLYNEHGDITLSLTSNGEYIKAGGYWASGSVKIPAGKALACTIGEATTVMGSTDATDYIFDASGNTTLEHIAGQTLVLAVPFEIDNPYVVKTFDGNWKVAGGAKTFLPAGYDLSAGQVTLAEVNGAPGGQPVIVGLEEGQNLPATCFLVPAQGDEVKDDYDDVVGNMSQRFVITDGEMTLSKAIEQTGVDASEAVILILTNGKFTTVDFSDADLDKLTKPGLLLFVLTKWEYMQIKPNQSAAAPIGARTIGIGDGNTTGITTTNFTNYTNEAGAWYDLQGRKLSKPTKKGIYIFNGKKVIK